MKKILFVTTNLSIGGITSSLLALLHTIDRSRFQIDLLMLEAGAESNLSFLPDKINVLHMEKSNSIERISNLFFYFSHGFYKVLRMRNENQMKNDVMNVHKYLLLRGMRYKKLEKQYDVAIAYCEGAPTSFVAYSVQAAKKLAWFHSDYKMSGFNPEDDYPVYRKFDKIVTVSDGCVKSLQNCFVELRDRCICVENMIKKKYIMNAALEKMEDFDFKNDRINLISVSRLDNKSKRLDRIVLACKKAIDRGIKIAWYIVGEGADRDKIQALINANNIGEYCFFVGAKMNPYPYIKKADLLVLSSEYEGKPIIVEEAMLLGTPVLTTKFNSIGNVVKNNLNGFVCDNNDQVFALKLCNICSNKELIAKAKKELNHFHIDYDKNMDQFYSLFQ